MLPQKLSAHPLYTPRRWVSISSLTSFCRCPRKFFYGSGLRLRSPSNAMSFGSAIHEVAPMILEGQTIDNVMQHFDTIWNGELDDDKRNKDRARCMLEDFARVHEGQRSLYKLLEPPKTNIIAERRSKYEIPFALDIEAPVPLVGWIDGLGQHRDTGELYAIEFKTTSQKGSWFLDSLTFNPQIIGYPVALTTIMDQPIRGTIVETLYVSSRETGTFLKPFDVPEWQMRDFLTWARWTTSTLIEYETKGIFPKNPAACTPYPMFGSPGFLCEYSRLCHLNDDWTTFLDTFEVSAERPFELA